MAEIKNIISADASSFNKGIEDARKSAKGFGQEVSSGLASGIAGFASLSMVVGKAVEAFNKFADIGDLAERFDMSSESIQRFSLVFEQSGSSAEGYAKSISKLKLAMADAVSGGEKSREVFAAAGISIESLSNGSVNAEQAFLKLADVIANTKDENQKLAAISDIFGAKMAGELLPILNQGSEALTANGNSATVMSDKMVGAMKGASDMMKGVGNDVQVLLGYLGVFFAGFLGGLKILVQSTVFYWSASFDAIVEIAKGIKDAMVFDFKGAKQHADNVVQTYKTMAGQIKGVFNEVKQSLNPDKTDKPIVGGSDLDKRKTEEQKKAAEDLKKKEEELAELRRRNELDALTNQERLNALSREYTELMLAAAKAGLKTKEGIDLQIQAEKKKAEIARVGKAVDDEKKKADDDEKKKAKELQEAKAKEADITGSTFAATQGKSEQLAEMKAKQSRLFAASEAETDPVEKQKKRNEALGMSKDIFNAAKSLQDSGEKPTVTSLQSIGLGGGFATPNDRQLKAAEEASKTLIEIRDALLKSSGEEPSAI